MADFVKFKKLQLFPENPLTDFTSSSIIIIVVWVTSSVGRALDF